MGFSSLVNNIVDDDDNYFIEIYLLIIWVHFHARKLLPIICTQAVPNKKNKLYVVNTCILAIIPKWMMTAASSLASLEVSPTINIFKRDNSIHRSINSYYQLIIILYFDFICNRNSVISSFSAYSFSRIVIKLQVLHNHSYYNFIG